MLQVLYPDVSKINRVLHLYPCFSTASPSPRCLLLLPAPARHPPLPSPLLDVGVATCCSHLLQLLATCMRLRSRWGCRLPTCSRAARAPRIGGRGMQVLWGETECRHGRAMALPLWKRSSYALRVTWSSIYANEAVVSCSTQRHGADDWWEPTVAVAPYLHISSAHALHAVTRSAAPNGNGTKLTNRPMIGRDGFAQR
jgi:hypothetical protein